MGFLETIFDIRDMLCESFTPEGQEGISKGRDYRFRSIVGYLVRPILWLLPIILPLIPVGWIVACIIAKAGILDIILYAIFGSLYVVFLGALIIVLLCALESFARIITSLILYNELPVGAENPVDFLICATFRGLFYK